MCECCIRESEQGGEGERWRGNIYCLCVSEKREILSRGYYMFVKQREILCIRRIERERDKKKKEETERGRKRVFVNV